MTDLPITKLYRIENQDVSKDDFDNINLYLTEINTLKQKLKKEIRMEYLDEVDRAKMGRESKNV